MTSNEEQNIMFSMFWRACNATYDQLNLKTTLNATLQLQPQKACLEDNSLKQNHKSHFQQIYCEEVNITF